jgi:enoyl-CoA hydratase
MASNTQVQARIDGTSATITFVTEDRPNVMSTEVLGRLEKAVQTVARAEGVRFCVLRGEGKVFVAGADIKEMASFDPARARTMAEHGHRVMDAIASLPCVTVAAIHGPALGGGCEIALACDFRIAVSSAIIGLPETSLGLIPGWAGTQRLPRLVGAGAARRLIFSAVPVSAEEAYKIGLVDEVVESLDALNTAVYAWRARFVKGGPRAIALAKQAMRTGDEVSAFVACFDEGESREGMGAFVEKRKAAWMEE